MPNGPHPFAAFSMLAAIHIENESDGTCMFELVLLSH